MKLKYIFMSMVMAATAMVGFTSCSDDDEDAPAPVDKDKVDLVLSADARVKVGSENRIALPIESGNGDYRAFSLAPEIADVVEDGGQYYIEGIKNGTARIVVSDGANNYKQIQVSVYTTETMTLSHENYTFVTPMGISSSSSECSVDLGNGGYTVESDNDKVVVSIEPEEGVITMTATSAKDEYLAVVTVTDCTGLTASINVTVTPTFDAFTANDLETLKNATSSDWYIKSNQFSQNRCSDLPYYERYGTWSDGDNGDGTHSFGWWEGEGSGTYRDWGGHKITYPEGTAVGEEVAGRYSFMYTYRQNRYELDGTVKVLKDDDTSKVVIWWDVDMENECINRGWIVRMK